MSNNITLAEPREEPKGLVAMLKSPKVRDGFANVATKYLTAERMVSISVNAVSKTPNLLKCNQSSVLGSVMTCTALGLEPNSSLGHAYLIPYKTSRRVNGEWVEIYECQFQIGYRGFIELARRIPELISLQAECIHENDFFDNMVGTDTYLKFRKTLKDRGEPIGAFAHAVFVRADGAKAEMSMVLPLEEIHKIRECSGTYKSLADKISQLNVSREEVEEAKAKGGQLPKHIYSAAKEYEKFDSTPWVQWFGEMAAKSAIKRLCKQLPLGRALAVASEVDNASDNGSLDLGKLSEVENSQTLIEHGSVPLIEHSEDDENALSDPLPEQQKQSSLNGEEDDSSDSKVRKATAKAMGQAYAAGKIGKTLPEDWAANPKLQESWDLGKAEIEKVEETPNDNKTQIEDEIEVQNQENHSNDQGDDGLNDDAFGG